MMVDLNKIPKVNLNSIPKVDLGSIPKAQPQSQPMGNLVFTNRGGLENPQGQAQVKTATETAGKEVQKKFENQENSTVQAVIDDLMATGTPLRNVTAEQLFSNENVRKAGLDNIAKVKSILDGYKLDKTSKIEANLQSSLEELIYLSDKIPTGSGFTGRYLTSGFNTGKQKLGSLPSKDVFDVTVSSTLASIAKAFGEVGNLSEFDQKSYEGLLSMLGHPQVEVRKEARESLARRLNKGIGINLGMASPFEIGKKINDKAKTPAFDSSSLSGEDKDAYDWASQNKNDPRAKKIFQVLGVPNGI